MRVWLEDQLSRELDSKLRSEVLVETELLPNSFNQELLHQALAQESLQEVRAW